MGKKYQVFSNVAIPKNGSISKIIYLDLGAHRMITAEGETVDMFKFIVQYNKSEAASSITITCEVSFDGIQFMAAASTVLDAFAGASGGSSNYQDVTGVTALNGWDVAGVLYLPTAIKFIITEGDALEVSNLDLVMVAA